MDIKKEIKRVQKLIETERNLDQISFYEGYIKGLRTAEEKEREILTTIYSSKLFKIMDYAFSRGSGHTYAQVKGVENVDNAILIVVDGKQNTGLPKEKQMSINDAKHFFIGSGRRHPVVIDHFALSTMLKEIINKI